MTINKIQETIIEQKSKNRNTSPINTTKIPKVLNTFIF